MLGMAVSDLGVLGIGGPIAGLIVLAYVLRPAVLAALQSIGQRYQSAHDERAALLARVDAVEARLEAERQGHTDCLELVAELRGELGRLERRQDRVEQRVSDSHPTSRG